MKIEDISERIKVRKVLQNSRVVCTSLAPVLRAQRFLAGQYPVTVALIMLLNLVALRPMAPLVPNQVPGMARKFLRKTTQKGCYRQNPVALLLRDLFIAFHFTGSYFASSPKVIFFPETDPQTVYVTMELPWELRSTKPIRFRAKWNQLLKKTLEPYKQIVKSVTTNVGNGKGGMFENYSQPEQITDVHLV
jgi:hypothetical protein